VKSTMVRLPTASRPMRTLSGVCAGAGRGRAMSILLRTLHNTTHTDWGGLS
jgi:hypothetical protein